MKGHGPIITHADQPVTRSNFPSPTERLDLVSHLIHFRASSTLFALAASRAAITCKGGQPRLSLTGSKNARNTDGFLDDRGRLRSYLQRRRQSGPASCPAV